MYLFDRECIEGVKEENNNKIFDIGNELYSDGEYQDAIEYYRLSAAMGNVSAVTKIGRCYLEGKGVKRDFSVARAYFKLGVTKGDINSLYRLGDLYISGLGVEKDERKAVEYYVESYNLIKSDGDIEKYPELLFRLGKVFMEGRLLEQNLDMAYQFFVVANHEFENRVEEENDREAAEYIKEIRKYIKALKKEAIDDGNGDVEYVSSFENDYFDDDINFNIDTKDEDDEFLGVNFFGKGSF